MNLNCAAHMAWSKVASGSPWSSIEIEAQDCLFDCANRVTDVICIMHVFVGNTERQPRLIWGHEARSSEFLNSAPDAELKIFLCHANAKIKTVWPYSCMLALQIRVFFMLSLHYMWHTCCVVTAMTS